MIGQDRLGRWVAQDQSGARGGLFVSRDAALRFAKAENGRPQAIIMVSGVLELDMTRAVAVRATRADDTRARRVA